MYTLTDRGRWAVYLISVVTAAAVVDRCETWAVGLLLGTVVTGLLAVPRRLDTRGRRLLASAAVALIFVLSVLSLYLHPTGECPQPPVG